MAALRFAQTLLGVSSVSEGDGEDERESVSRGASFWGGAFCLRRVEVVMGGLSSMLDDERR